GYIALHSGIATGAENILIPETEADIESMISSLTEKEKRKKLVNLIVVAEGYDGVGGASGLAEIIRQRLPAADVRICVLGHIQRGGSPTCEDRLVASHMGYYAVESLMVGRKNVMVGVINNKIHYTPLDKAVKERQKIGQEWMKIVKILAS
ncbi:MAG TPA: 6-phosphofructokinase, partial [Chitinophagaceae bacterium]|nr:6-phosphofructokinase [Chitinophagaceae bacterium]